MRRAGRGEQGCLGAVIGALIGFALAYVVTILLGPLRIAGEVSDKSFQPVADFVSFLVTLTIFVAAGITVGIIYGIRAAPREGTSAVEKRNGIEPGRAVVRLFVSLAAGLVGGVVGLVPGILINILLHSAASGPGIEADIAVPLGILGFLVLVALSVVGAILGVVFGWRKFGQPND